MRFTFLTPADDLTGGMRVIATYARLLQQRGHDVQVVSNAAGKTSLRQRLRLFRRGHIGAALASGAAPSGHLANTDVPRRVLDQPRPIDASDVPDGDVLVATWWETAEWASTMPATKGRQVHLIQGFETWGGAADQQRFYKALRLPNLKLVISDSLAQDIQAALGPLHLTVVPNGVDTEQFQAPPRDRRSPPVVGYAYSPLPIKGADVCAQACELARQAIPNLKVLAFGAEPPSPQVPLARGADFVLRPAQHRLAPLYAGCDAWLFGSRQESFGLPILEAMACRTPVVGAAVGAAPALLANGEGRLVEVDAPQAMADALVQLLTDSAQAWRETSQRAWARAQACSWSSSVDQFLRAVQGSPAA